MNGEKLFLFSTSWKGSASLLFSYMAGSVFLSRIVGGDVGAMGWTGFHFVLMPLISLLVLLLVIVRFFARKENEKTKWYLLGCVFVPGLIIYFAFTGNVEIVKLLGVQFN